MVRIKFEVVPGGVEELAYEVDRLTVACRFPLGGPEQDFHVIYHDKYSKVKQFPVNSSVGWLDLARAALEALAERSLTLTGKEVFPGALALEPEEFGDLLRRLAAAHAGVLHSIKLFGRRSRELVTYKDFWAKARALPRLPNGRPDVTGDFLAEHWPGYVEWDVAVRLTKKCYQTKSLSVEGQTYPSIGHALEDVITERFGLRQYPHDGVPMQCGNGVRFTFLRPGGELASPLTRADYEHKGKWSSAGKPAAADAKFSKELVRDIAAGPLLWDLAHGLAQPTTLPQLEPAPT